MTSFRTTFDGLPFLKGEEPQSVKLVVCSFSQEDSEAVAAVSVY